MAWNLPGGNRQDNPPPSARGNGLLAALRERLQGFGPGGGGVDGNIWRWVAIAVGLWLAFSSFVLITEQQRGVVLRFGQFARVLQPGPNFKLPWPIERVVKLNATQIKTFSETVPVLTADENIVSVEINVQYRVGDPQQFLFGTRDAEQVLAQAALSTVREQVGRSTLDTVLGARGALAVSARQQLQESLNSYRTGLVVTELNLPNARPPEEVKPAFDDVNSAQQDKDRLISEAQAYAAKIVPEARGEASRTRTLAEGYKTATIARATGDSNRFNLLVAQYKLAPEVTRKRLWLETVQQVLAENRTVVGGDGRQLIYVPMPAAGNASDTTVVRPPLLPPDEVVPAATPTPAGARTPRSNAADPRKENTR